MTQILLTWFQTFCVNLFTDDRSGDISVSIVTMLRAGWQEFNSPVKVKNGFFFNASIIDSYAMIVEERRQVTEVDNTSPSSTVVKSVCICTSTLPYMFTGRNLIRQSKTLTSCLKKKNLTWDIPTTCLAVWILLSMAQHYGIALIPGIHNTER